VEREVGIGLAQHGFEPVAQFAVPGQERRSVVDVGRLVNGVLHIPFRRPAGIDEVDIELQDGVAESQAFGR
jgi:hypothetical protein